MRFGKYIIFSKTEFEELKSELEQDIKNKQSKLNLIENHLKKWDDTLYQRIVGAIIFGVGIALLGLFVFKMGGKSEIACQIGLFLIGISLYDIIPEDKEEKYVKTVRCDSILKRSITSILFLILIILGLSYFNTEKETELYILSVFLGILTRCFISAFKNFINLL